MRCIVLMTYMWRHLLLNNISALASGRTTWNNNTVHISWVLLHTNDKINKGVLGLVFTIGSLQPL